MKTVKQYFVNLDHGTLCSPQPGCDQAVVKAEELDQVVAERDALRLEAGTMNETFGMQEDKIDALQQRLTAADERVDLLETALKKISVRCEAYIEAEREMPEPSVEVCQMIASAALKPAEPHAPCACIGCEASKVSSSLFCTAHQSAKSRTREHYPVTGERLEFMMQNDGDQQ